MLEAMTKNGIPGRIELLIGASHGWGDPELRRTAASSFAFFDDHLKAKPGTAKAPEKPANPPAGRG